MNPSAKLGKPTNLFAPAEAVVNFVVPSKKVASVANAVMRTSVFFFASRAFLVAASPESELVGAVVLIAGIIAGKVTESYKLKSAEMTGFHAGYLSLVVQAVARVGLGSLLGLSGAPLLVLFTAYSAYRLSLALDVQRDICRIESQGITVN